MTNPLRNAAVNRLDINSILGDYVPYTGATENVDLGAFSITASNFSGSSSGTNTGDQTITLSSDVTGSGTGAIITTVAKINGATLGTTTATSGNILIGSGTAWETKTVSGDFTLASTGAGTLATVNSNTGTFGGISSIPSITLDAKGRATACSNISVQGTTNQINLDTTGSNIIFSTPQDIDTGADVTFNSVTADLIGNADTATAASTVNTSNEATDTTCFPLFATASGTQTLEPKNNTSFTFNSSSKNLGVAGATITGLSDTTHLVVKEHSSQTSNPVEVRTSADATIFRVLAAGDIQVSNQVAIEQTSTGDAVLKTYLTGSTTVLKGIDNSDSDKYKETFNSSDVGTNPFRVVTTAGEQTMPLQPAFLAKPTSDDLNVTGDNTNYTVTFGTEIFDQNGDFASNTFTAPVTGRYQLSTEVYLFGIGTQTSASIFITTSNRTYEMMRVQAANTKDASNQLILVASILADMDAADTATINTIVFGSTKTVDVANSSYFSGFLAC